MRWPVYTTGLVKTDADGQVLIKLANLDFGLTRSEELNHEGLTDEFVLEMLDAERKLVRCDFVRVELRVEQIGHHTSDRSTPKPVSVRWRPHVSPNRNVIKFNCKGMRLKGNVRLSAAIKLTAKNSQVKWNLRRHRPGLLHTGDTLTDEPANSQSPGCCLQ